MKLFNFRFWKKPTKPVRRASTPSAGTLCTPEPCLYTYEPSTSLKSRYRVTSVWTSTFTSLPGARAQQQHAQSNARTKEEVRILEIHPYSTVAAYENIIYTLHTPFENIIYALHTPFAMMNFGMRSTL